MRRHRPDYTPRTGFVWPIVDPSMADDPTAKKRTSPEETAATGSQEPTEDAAKQKAASSNGVPKRQTNNILLMNAMHATAAHSAMSFSSSTFVASAESTSDTPANHMHSSVTPAPSQGTTPKVPPSTGPSQESSSKAPSTGVKKKKKRIHPTLHSYPHKV